MSKYYLLRNIKFFLESISYRQKSIKIQKIIAILKIPQIGECVPLVVEGASEDKLLQLVMPILKIKY